MDASDPNFLLCTVGGSPDPVVASLKHWRPQRVYFIATSQSRSLIEENIATMALAEGFSLDAGRYEVIELADGQDFSICLDSLRPAAAAVQVWLDRSDSHQVIVDFTGGTKPMSAALAVQALRWRCVFSYIGGDRRTKEGVGIVVAGTERVVHAHNPWDSLGFQTVAEYIVLFDQQAFRAAAELAKLALHRLSKPSRKEELNGLVLLAEAFDAWDRFDHDTARDKLNKLQRHENNLQAVLGPVAVRLLNAVAAGDAFLAQLPSGNSPTTYHVLDLLANARRRQREGRLDDAVARLYRAVESLAQLALADRHQIMNTKTVPLVRVPPPLVDQWQGRSDEGYVSLGLQDAYALLAALGDPLGVAFKQLNLHDRERSPLTARNQSILAHGFQRVRAEVFDRLWTATLQLAQIEERALPSFPRIAH